MAANSKLVTVLPLFAAAITVLGTVEGTPAHAENPGLWGSVNIHHTTVCGPLAPDPQLAAAAQRHANDMLNSGVTRHTGSDGSTPGVRIIDAGVTFSRNAEIVYWGTGSSATPDAALDWWMNQSPTHRAIILDCGLTAAGAATASDNNKMTAVVNFITP